MNTRKQGSLLVLTLALAFGLVFQSQAASYPAPTKYKQTMVRVFTESQVSDWLAHLRPPFPANGGERQRRQDRLHGQT